MADYGEGGRTCLRNRATCSPYHRAMFLSALTLGIIPIDCDRTFLTMTPTVSRAAQWEPERGRLLILAILFSASARVALSFRLPNLNHPRPARHAKLSASPPTRVEPTISSDMESANQTTLEACWNVQLNEFFKKPVPRPVREKLSLYRETNDPQKHFSVMDLLAASPGAPGVPRPLWLVILGSVPTGLVWYGYYKFCVEEELMQMEIAEGRTPRGFGGFGTLGPFVYGCLLGPLAFLMHLPGGLQWTNMGIAFIYYTQFVLYDRVNQLYRDQGEEEPLPRK